MNHPVFSVPATPAEAARLLDEPLEALLDSAAALREQHHGKCISLCAIINARSGDCGMDCRFCSQSSHNHTPIAHFPFLGAGELRERILRLAAWPVRRIGIVTSGGALEEQELHCLLAVVRDLPEDVRRRVCTSLGRLPEKHLRELEQAGVRRYHHNLETSRAYYPRICTTQLWDQRRDTALRAQAAGLSVCAGGLFGLGESWEDRVDFAFSLRELGVRHVPMNFLHPHPQTPLAGQPLLEPEEALRIIALFRHILPEASLRICGGRPETLRERQSDMFRAGADALMTGDYLTTQGMGVEDDIRMIEAAGLEVARP
ncbi:biotin synthase BioB [Desulfovibrio piger]|uniref:biotin synthase BioB n=1 Tax=Desulfovibrio piger TaxID=901 RepID=UPI00242E1CC3|nr:biotin synthase BioB [Desulfovibrio piger]MCI7508160.1 biotin synthase BioB [Desulfovibrio piger]